MHAQQGTVKNIRLFTYEAIRLATSNFHASRKIGRGGFGMVYKGILRDGVPVAVKVLSTESKQGVNEFLTEIDTISTIKHPNLVELIGCCLQGTNRILVYEYMENGNLHQALLGANKNMVKLSWSKRSSICIGTAKGLAFLHEEVEPHIVHRDIKASNILLDCNFKPKIGDFGLAKLFPDDVTHISTRVAGTTGYLAPEYAMHGQLTKKADVYSFGVLVLVIVSGRSLSKSSEPDMEQYLLESTWRLYEEGKLVELVDKELKDYPQEEVERFIKVALFCTQTAAGRRPTMPQVVRMLSRPVRLNEAELMPPGILTDSSRRSRSASSTNNSHFQVSSSTTDVTAVSTTTAVTDVEAGR